MDDTLLMLHSALATLSACALYLSNRLFKKTQTARDESEKYINSIKTAHNTHADTIENMIRKIQDMETMLAIARKERRV